MKEHDAPVTGIGATTNFDDVLSPSLVLHRLNLLASLDLPIWISAYSYSNVNKSMRAEMFNDFFLAVFR